MVTFTMEDAKFYLAWLTVVTIFWRSAAWVTRKQIVVETFFADTRKFMVEASGTLQRIETNHLAHQEKYLKHIAKAVGAEVAEDDSDAIPE